MIREPLDVGRECAGLIIDDPRISRRHVELSVDINGLVVTDVGSTNGTFVNGTRVEVPTAIGPDDVITIGNATLRVDPVWAAQQAPPPSAKRHGGGTLVAGGAAEFAVVTPVTPELASRRTSIDIVADAVAESALPDVAELVNDEGTLTIVFSDIESSTEMAANLGDAKWLEVLEIHNSIIRKEVADHNGREIKSQGDGFMLSFASARRAVMAMMRVQHLIESHAEAHPETGVRVRIGIHTGEVILTGDGDLFGRHVIMAARIAGQAVGGQILVSGLVRQITEGGGDLPFGESMPTMLKGLGDKTYETHEVRWQDCSLD